MGDRSWKMPNAILISVILHASLIALASLELSNMRDIRPSLILELIATDRSANSNHQQEIAVKTKEKNRRTRLVAPPVQSEASSPEVITISNRELASQGEPIENSQNFMASDDILPDLILTPPAYPKRCQSEQIEGVVEINVEFKSDGSVRSASLKKGIEACPEFAAVSIQVVLNARLNKALAQLESRSATLPFRFRLFH